MRVLIGYDGSTHADAAIEDLTRAGIPADAEFMIGSVGDLLMSSPEISEMVNEVLTPVRLRGALSNAQSHADRVTAEAEEAAKRAEELVNERFPFASVISEVMIGTPAWVLMDAANKWNADLIVTGSQGRGTLSRLFLGSVSKRLVTDADSSVRVARPIERDGDERPPRIIIGVDGSPSAERAVFAVGQRVWPAGTEVRLVSVDDSMSPVQIATRLPQAAAMISSYFGTREKRVSEMLDWAQQELGNIGITASVVTAKGDPKDVILAQANEWQADSIFVGTRDLKNALERFRLGSVSTALVTNAQTSVEVVRPAAEAA